MNIRKRFVAVAVTGVFAGGSLIGSTATTAGAATEGEVVAQSCYGNAWGYSKPEGANFQPSSGALYFATDNCADINIKTNTSRKVKVCFYASGGGLDYCQSAYKTTTAGEWKVIASDVKDGTKFKFQFASPAASTGMRAH
ncbi:MULTISPECIES: hypothetical protein [unclassified Streptomyces]|uniref:hypothetical protein n=1 Tax=unclassified Streptomyces TaxID=2593676 RepID=UPI0023669470|nr:MULTISPECIES: hypothetical protein [unclassified Streptomyces]MDF3147074.1 hypothetical protein [Streptomyces sp. T21Q-yed]WDF40703.1 hypothetical protein PBV52_29930 [Streptomyces sp. T12]